ncbi:type IV pilus modification protein PilV [Pseudomonas paeninsulae]|uniref:type IV pilus modification protein PilV n=1 Tax=Pseudomonas paeninsulae TaxID=3110772 RepID=UPI002D79288D|nr:type IV pilus modification protein PilV [Pseudomonas sp. IT1137]
MRPARIYTAFQAGFTLIEVLITLLVLAVGLMGLAGMQARMLNSQFEAYQRAQAVMLVGDMANRLRSNVSAARDARYVSATLYGINNALGDATDCTSGNVVENDLCAWNQALKGASITEGTQKLSAMIGARGCIESISGSATSQMVVRVTVVWQGLSPTVAPASACGKESYGDDRQRREVFVDVTLAYLGV